jgi:hypothetical protein
MQDIGAARQFSNELLKKFPESVEAGLLLAEQRDDG